MVSALDGASVIIVGGGLAGSEAALQLAARGVSVRLIEMRPVVPTAVHRTDALAELVCSNSFKSVDADSAAGCLKKELEILGSFLLPIAFDCRVPAGGALAVDRDRFSGAVTRAIEENPLITLERREIDDLTELLDSGEHVIIATGPLTSDALANGICELLGSGNLSFYDAAAPIVEKDSLDMDVLFAQSRYDRDGSADYLNAPMTKDEYDAFMAELLAARRVIAKDFERKELFAACQPVEEVARTGHDALRFGALKPVGLTDPRTGRRPWAAVQLRAENAQASAYNLVGFQTNLAFGEQERVFRMIPGLENAVFSRYGVMHRNTFVDAPHTLDRGFAVPLHPKLRFAGQVCGTEGYMEAVASGLYAALNVYAQLMGLPQPHLPIHSVLGALFDYATDPETQDYQPMHVNYGIMEPFDPPIRNKRERYAAYSQRARAAMTDFVTSNSGLFPQREW
ncbi:MAG: methylenetetrahydrofolate--tRNA-(uracil(54)-C(5))-methyltransferase (FADH(2)-oxidizing) TrmFO [Coriobacteriales bacterium]|nr:methylenetetrahydrofolate--tRNA-(uracil(54)-C(5))-methyltransferase (FADH(2)-oxidizing) TrmFO [Coriobacteriales bacterium]